MAAGESTISISVPDENLKCGICGKLAKDAVQHDFCGVLFCSECTQTQNSTKIKEVSKFEAFHFLPHRE